MSDTGTSPTGWQEFRRVLLVDDHDRAMKLLLGTGNLFNVPEGTLRVVGNRLDWIGSSRVVSLEGVTYLDVVRDGLIGVDYQGPNGKATAVLQDRSRGQMRSVATTIELAKTLRDALGLAPKTPEEQAAASALVVSRAEAKMRSARIRMIVFGVLAGAGAVATYVGYSNADPGDSYTIWWGAVLFGVLWFIVGAAEYAGASKQKAAALAAPASGAVTPAAPASPSESSPPAARPLTPAVGPETYSPPAPAPPPPAPSPPAYSPPAPPPPPPAPPAPAPAAPAPAAAPPPAPAPSYLGPTVGFPTAAAPTPAPTAAAWMPADERATGRRSQRVAVAVAVGVGVVAILVAVGFALTRDGSDDDGGEDVALVPVDVENESDDEEDIDTLPTVPSTVSSSSTTQAPSEPAPISDTILTSLGPAVINDIRFVDRSPAGCQPPNPSCANSVGNRIVVFLLRLPAGTSPEVLITGLQDEFFASQIIDETGGVAFAKSISTVGDATVEVVYDQITVDNPTSLRLEWPGADPISLPI